MFLKGAREGWPVIGSLVKLVVKDEFALRDRFMRENLDVMARRIGEMQAKLLQLESLGERVSGLAGINPADIKARPGQGGALVSGRPLTMDELQKTLEDLDRVAGQRTDLMSVVESRLFEQKVKTMMIPTQHPVEFGGAGSGFGWRIDPFTGRSALHTGIDYQSPIGTSILAAAGGVVVTQEFRPDYGNMVEIDHGKDLVTRYAHASKITVKKGDLVKRGQKLAEVGTTGRSTGPHLHFEVLVRGGAPGSAQIHDGQPQSSSTTGFDIDAKAGASPPGSRITPVRRAGVGDPAGCSSQAGGRARPTTGALRDSARRPAGSGSFVCRSCPSCRSGCHPGPGRAGGARGPSRSATVESSASRSRCPQVPGIAAAVQSALIDLDTKGLHWLVVSMGTTGWYRVHGHQHPYQNLRQP